jgi:hypothetical protein
MATVGFKPTDGKKPQAQAGSFGFRRVSGFHPDDIHELFKAESSRGCFGRTTWGMHLSLETIEKGQFRRP